MTVIDSSLAQFDTRLISAKIQAEAYQNGREARIIHDATDDKTLDGDRWIQRTGSRSDTEGNKHKLIREVMLHRCGGTIREQVKADRAGAGQTGS